MVVAATEAWGTIGGGNLEATAISRARDLLADGAFTPTMIHQDLTEHAAGEFGRQCCGGSSTVLLEPLPVPASVAIFGMGHVGRELARLLSRHDLDLHLVDGGPVSPYPPPCLRSTTRSRTSDGTRGPGPIPSSPTCPAAPTSW